MPRLAMHRNRHPRLYPGIHLFEFLPTRVPGDMHQGIGVGNELAAAIDQLVVDAANGALIAGDGARRENHQVAALQADMRMLTLGDARHRRPWLTLTARTQDHGFVALEITKVFLIVILEIAG